ncbi:MAG: ATP-binding cassette domain-containing protein [Candidatus Aminicenantes bacterium]|nr:ATP-binding cassette domain-containing protein [Candidatus Aminicenantes bacterium]
MIEVNDLWKTFKLSRQQKKEKASQPKSDMVNAVAGIHFICRPGRIFSLIGPNGAGKTTTLRIVATLLKPTKGSVTVCGFDTVKQPREVKSRLGFLTGTTRLYERLTAEELVRYYADLQGLDRSKYEKRKNELFTLLDMHGFANWRISKLSSGMRQKVSIARTIIHDPEVVVFDEPTVGLDVITAKNIIELIHMCRDDGKTVIFSTHIMGEVSLLSDDMALIHKGKLLFNGTYKDFQSHMKKESLEEEFIRLVQEVQP